jgi:transposase
MARPSNNYPAELRERSVAMFNAIRKDYPSDWKAAESIAEKLNVRTAQTVLNWVRKAQVDAGERAGMTSEEAAEMRKLRAEKPRAEAGERDFEGGVSFLRGGARPPTSDLRVHRREQGQIWGRANLPRAHRAPLSDCPIDLLRRPQPASVRAGTTRCRTQEGNHHHSQEELLGVWRAQGVDGIAPQGYRCCSLHCRAINEGAGSAGCAPGSTAAHYPTEPRGGAGRRPCSDGTSIRLHQTIFGSPTSHMSEQ